MYVHGVGEGRPLVLVHGWRLNGEVERADYEPIFARRRGWRRLYPDLPGMGRSPAEPWISRKDTRVGYEQAWNAAQHYPRATFALLDRAGHELPVGSQELFAALVNDWLDRVEEAW